jgi:amino acid transporter
MQPDHGLRRELRLRDLVPMQIVLIVWLGWSGFAAKQGPSQAVLWLFAIVFFYIPLAATVMKVSRSLPVEGGVYQWVKAGVSPFAGFMAGWNVTVYAVIAFAAYGSFLVNGLAHALGPGSAWMPASKPFNLACTALGCIIAFVFNARGLQLAKLWSNMGAALTAATFAVLAFLLARAWILALPSAREAASFAWPGLSMVTFGVFTKMALGALSGFDTSGIFAEECRKPANDVARSVMLASPLIALMYIVATSAVLAYVPPQQVDVAAAIPQVIQRALGVSGAGPALALLATIAFDVSFTASVVVVVGAVARLPMVAGWDNLLPGWWSELHPKHRTPVKALAAVSVAIFGLSAATLIGAGNEEAVDVLTSSGIGCLCVVYMLLFSTILLGLRGTDARPSVWLRIGAGAGFCVALLGLFFQIAPLTDVANRTVFASKVAGGILLTHGFGALLYWRGARRAALLRAGKRVEKATV